MTQTQPAKRKRLPGTRIVRWLKNCRCPTVV